MLDLKARDPYLEDQMASLCPQTILIGIGPAAVLHKAQKVQLLRD